MSKFGNGEVGLSQLEPSDPVYLPSILGSLGVKDPLAAGSYELGLVSVLDSDLAGRLLRSWRWLLPEAVPFIATGFGDLFVWQGQSGGGVSFLEVQRGTTTFVDREVGWVLTEFLRDPGVLQGVLRAGRFLDLVGTNRALKYGEALVLEPWALLGGRDLPANYSIGSLEVYIDLVGQTLALA